MERINQRVFILKLELGCNIIELKAFSSLEKSLKFIEILRDKWEEQNTDMDDDMLREAYVLKKLVKYLKRGAGWGNTLEEAVEYMRSKENKGGLISFYCADHDLEIPSDMMFSFDLKEVEVKDE